MYSLINWPSEKTRTPEIPFPTIWSYNYELQFDLKKMQIRAIDILVKTPIFDNQFDEHHTLDKLSVITLNFLPLCSMSEPSVCLGATGNI